MALFFQTQLLVRGLPCSQKGRSVNSGLVCPEFMAQYWN
jgi:hypothetical protein